MKVFIIIPAHNEEHRISNTLEAYGKFFSKKIKEKVEILVVLNACTDNTLKIVKKYIKKYKIVKYLDFEESGKGFAIIEGFKYVLKKNKEESILMGFVDADLATVPAAFYELVKNINDYDGIIASRWIKGAVVKKEPFLRRFLGRGFNYLVRSLLFMPYRDTQCGAKVFRGKAIQAVIESLGFTKWVFDVELLYKLRKKGFKIKERPTVWEDKKGSKLDVVKVPFQMFSGVLRMRLLNSPFKFIVRFYNKLPERLKIHH